MIPVVVHDLSDLHADAIADGLFGYQLADGLDPPDLPAVGVHVGVGCKSGDDTVVIEGIYRVDVPRNDRWQCGHELIGHCRCSCSSVTGHAAGLSQVSLLLQWEGQRGICCLTLPHRETSRDPSAL